MAWCSAGRDALVPSLVLIVAFGSSPSWRSFSMKSGAVVESIRRSRSLYIASLPEKRRSRIRTAWLIAAVSFNRRVSTPPTRGPAPKSVFWLIFGSWSSTARLFSFEFGEGVYCARSRPYEFHAHRSGTPASVLIRSIPLLQCLSTRGSTEDTGLGSRLGVRRDVTRSERLSRSSSDSASSSRSGDVRSLL